VTVERLDNRDIRRTGWLTGVRRCPLHDCELELCFDETDHATWHHAFRHDDNRVSWRCDRCVGRWTENHFLYPASRPVVGPRLVVTCPACGGRRVSHTCVVGCCESHACVDCGAAYDVRARVVTPGLSEPRDLPHATSGARSRAEATQERRTNHLRPGMPRPELHRVLSACRTALPRPPGYVPVVYPVSSLRSVA